MSDHTPGPWRWEINRNSKSIALVGGRPLFDKTVMQFERWGMGNAAPAFNEAIAGGQYNIMTRVSDRPDWIKPLEGRSHHFDWCATVVHPDAVLMAAAPEMLEALRFAVVALAAMLEQCPPVRKEYEIVSQAIAKATGAA